MFKVYESKLGVPRFTFHTAFDDPATKPKDPPRHSIEVRSIVCYHDDDKGTKEKSNKRNAKAASKTKAKPSKR